MSVIVSPTGEPVEVRETLVDTVHTIQDARWLNITQDPQAYMQGQDFLAGDRNNILWRIRNIARQNPAAKWACKMGANYTFGTGVSVKCLDTRYVAPVLQEFWNDPQNQRSLTGVQAQTERFIDLYRDGDLFLVMFVNEETGRCTFRRLDAAFVADIITDEDDILRPRYYKVLAQKWAYDFNLGTYSNTYLGSNRFVYLRDWNFDEDDGGGRPAPGEVKPGLVFHLAINREAKFGFSELYSSQDWLNVHKQFMEDRASLARALAQFAWKVKRKDTPAGIRGFAGTLQSSYAQGILTMFERNPPQAAGATLVENEGSTREPIKVESGAGSAATEGEGFMNMAASGMGTYSHYLGFGAVHRLATANAMELPALKNYEWWQMFWRSGYYQILQRVMDEAIKAGRIPASAGQRMPGGYITAGAEGSPSIYQVPTVVGGRGFRKSQVDRGITIEFPPILTRDLAGVVNAISSLATNVAPINVESRKLLLRIALLALGVEDVDQAVEIVFPDEGVLLPSKTPEEGVNTVVRAGPGGSTQQLPGEPQGEGSQGSRPAPMRKAS